MQAIAYETEWNYIKRMIAESVDEKEKIMRCLYEKAVCIRA